MFFALACFAIVSGDPTPLFITAALILGYLLDIVLTVKAVFLKKDSVRVVAGVVTQRTTYYVVFFLGFAARQLIG
jgi:hypothetical protein